MATLYFMSNFQNDWYNRKMKNTEKAWYFVVYNINPKSLSSGKYFQNGCQNRKIKNASTLFCGHFKCDVVLWIFIFKSVYNINPKYCPVAAILKTNVFWYVYNKPMYFDIFTTIESISIYMNFARYDTFYTFYFATNMH